MNSARQQRKAVHEIVLYLQTGQTEKACYAIGLLNQMLDSIDNGKPRPWSEFKPMLEEEFS